MDQSNWPTFVNEHTVHPDNNIQTNIGVLLSRMEVVVGNGGPDREEVKRWYDMLTRMVDWHQNDLRELAKSYGR